MMVNALSTGLTRLLAVAGLLVVSLLAYKVLHVPVDLLPWTGFVVVLAAGAIFALKTTAFSFGTALIPFLYGSLIYFTVFIDSFFGSTIGVSPKSNALGFVFTAAFCAFYVLKDFKFFWQSWLFRLSFLFSVTGLLYLAFGHTSNFELNAVSAGYPLDFGDETGGVDAKIIVLIAALGISVGITSALSVFDPKLNQPTPSDAKIKPQPTLPLSELSPVTAPWLENALPLLFSLFGIGVLLFNGAALAFFFKQMFALGVYMPILFVPACVSWALLKQFYPDFTLIKGKLAPRFWVGAACLIGFLFLPLAVNKTGLVGAFASYAVFFFLAKNGIFLEPFKKTVTFINEGLAPKLVLVLFTFVAIIAVTQLGIIDLVMDKVDYFVSGFSNAGTLRIRTGNWFYFFQEWQSNANVFNTLFGHGLASSRETIFFVSAMRRAGERTLVQTLHNSYLEYLYDYGVMSLLYFGLYGRVIWSAVKDIWGRVRTLSETTFRSPTRRMLGAAQISLIIYIAIYGMLDGIRVQVLIQLFSLLTLFECMKPYFEAKERKVESANLAK